MIEFRDFLQLSETEFLYRIHQELQRVAQTDQPLPATRLPRPADFLTDPILLGMLSLNLEKGRNWKNAGRVRFQLRSAEGNWQSYDTDQDNQVLMELPIGKYYLQIGPSVNQTFEVVLNETVNLEF